jgi:hypothetical protein
MIQSALKDYFFEIISYVCRGIVIGILIVGLGAWLA